jgi:PhzF family phenazine biosynthesis protein
MCAVVGGLLNDMLAYMSRPFEIIDVFGSGAFSGNPVAVVHHAEGLTTDEMMAITRWMNLSETTFLLEATNSEADYRVRIFTLRGELPFAGHPTLGTCHAWLSAGGRPAGEVVVQECGIGLVPLRRGERLSFAAPPLIRSGPVDDRFVGEIAAVLGIRSSTIVGAEWVDNGPGWVGILLEDSESVLALEPDIGRYRGSEQLDIGVVAPHPDGNDVDFEVRAFFADDKGQLVEDPVTGSLNASLAQWLIEDGRAPDSYVAAQGTSIGRAGRIHITRDGSGVWVGGSTTTHVFGEID